MHIDRLLDMTSHMVQVTMILRQTISAYEAGEKPVKITKARRSKRGPRPCCIRLRLSLYCHYWL